MDATRVTAIARGTLSGDALEPHERAIEALVAKSVREPARLAPSDLTDLLRTLGRIGTAEVVAMLCAFHFINRIADLTGIRSDLPVISSVKSPLWRLGAQLQGLMMRAFMRLDNRQPDAYDPASTLAEVGALRGIQLPAGYKLLAEAPGPLAWLATCRDSWGRIDADLLTCVSAAVAAALPSSVEEIRGFHARPDDPLVALAFVGTRYAARTTNALVDAVRVARKCDDGELTDIFYTIAMCNCWERLDRLLATEPHAMGA